MTSIYRTSTRRLLVQTIGAIALVFALWSMWALWPPARHRDWLPAIAAFWTLLPPIWFFFEYAYVFDNWENKDAVAHFKDMQGHAAKIWAGMLALLTASYFLDKELNR